MSHHSVSVACAAPPLICVPQVRKVNIHVKSEATDTLDYESLSRGGDFNVPERLQVRALSAQHRCQPPAVVRLEMPALCHVTSLTVF